MAHGDLDEILPALVELGADAIHVFQQPGTEKSRLSDKAVARWQRIITGAVKQSKRSFIPAISTHESLNSVLNLASQSNLQPLVLHDEATTSADSAPIPDAGWMTIIGSERGFSGAELAVLGDRRVPSVQIGRHILRAKTAAIAVCAILGLRRG